METKDTHTTKIEITKTVNVKNKSTEITVTVNQQKFLSYHNYYPFGVVGNNRLQNTPLDLFMEWLAANNQSQRGANAANNGAKPLGLRRKRWFQIFNLKQKLLNIFSQ